MKFDILYTYNITKMREDIKQLLEKLNIHLEDPTPVLGEEYQYYYTYIVVPDNEKSKMYLKVYFGQHTTNRLDDDYIASGIKIKSYLKKYPQQFYRKILGFYNNTDELNQAEKDLIDCHLNKDYCLNLKEGGANAKWSDESKKKLSDTMKGDSCWMRGRTGELNPFCGKHHSDEIKKKLSAQKKGDKHPNWGKHHSEETKKKMSEALKGDKHPMFGRTGEDSPWWGKHHSEESRRKMSEAHKGRNFQDSMTPEAIEEWRKNLSESLKGKMVGDKNPMHGKHHSDEAKKKMSKALKGKMVGDKNPMHGKTGELNPNAKRIEIDGIPYGSIEDAVAVKGNSRSTIRNWLKSGRAKYL